MADAVTTTILENGPRNWVVRCTNFSDGTGESAVLKVDGSATGPLGVTVRGQTFFPLTHIKVTDIEYDIHNNVLRILWGGTPNVDLLPLGGFGRFKFRERLGPLFIPVGTPGATGQILFTFAGGAANSSYSVVMRGTKGIPQS